MSDEDFEDLILDEDELYERARDDAYFLLENDLKSLRKSLRLFITNGIRIVKEKNEKHYFWKLREENMKREIRETMKGELTELKREIDDII